jgi:adenosylmethionine-8-amino-7-oxononanoate aminotransferase
MITIAKGLGAGYQPIGALLTSGAIYDAIDAGSGFFQHGHTYMGHAMAAAGARAVLTAIHERGLLARVREMGEVLDTALRERFGQHPHVGDIRGRGLFRGLELVADRESKALFDPARKLHAKIKAYALEAGLICYPMGGTIDGQRGDHVLLAPPFIIGTDQIGELVDKLAHAVEGALAA